MSNLMKKIRKLAKNPAVVLKVLLDKDWSRVLSDKTYLQWMYRLKIGQKLNLENPAGLNEKLQWLKLYDRRPEYIVMADKYLVRDYIAEKLGQEHLIPLLGVWDDPDDIDFDALPDQFVLKCNHNSGLGMCICKDKSKLDIAKVKEELRKGLRQDYYLHGREWPYKDSPRKIVCEKFMTDSGAELADFKIHNFNGEPRFVLVCRDRFQATGLTEDFFSEKWEHLDIKRPNVPNASQPIPEPAELAQMLEFSRILAKDIPFVRTDFYVIDHKVYFGEITFFPASGMSAFEPESWDDTFGSWLELPEKKEICV